MSSLLEFFFGSPDKFKKLENFTPGQMQNFNQLNDFTGRAGEGAGNALDYFARLLNNDSSEYANFEAPYRQEFEQDIVPRLAEQYAGRGALSSSGFGQALGSAGAALQTRLAAMKAQMRQNAATGLLGQYNTSLGQSLNARPFDYRQQQGNAGLLNTALAAGLGGLTGGGSLASILMSALGSLGNRSTGTNVGGKLTSSAGASF